MDDAKKGLLNGTIVYFIGQALISLIQLLLLPFITGKLEPEAYGYFDLIISTSNLIFPFITLQIIEAIFAYFFKANEQEKKSYFTVTVLVLFLGILMLSIGLIAFNFLVKPIEHLILVALYLISNLVLMLYTKMARCLNKNIDYVISNFIKAVFYIVFQLVFLYVFNMKVESLFLSNILSIIICIIILEFKIKLIPLFEYKKFDNAKLRQLLKFSIPLVPNVLFWWFLSSFNTYVISFKLGLSTNGIYTVANKFSGILTMVTSVILMSWQESAIKEYELGKKTNFFNEVTNQFIIIVLSAIAILIPFIKIVMPFMINKAYYDSIIYAPILVLGVGISSFNSFYSSMYAATKRTAGIMYTTIHGVIINALIVFLLIDKIGLFAPAIAVICSNTVIAIIRHYTFKKQLQLRIKIVPILALIFLLFANTYIYYRGNLILFIISFAVDATVALILNKKLIFSMLRLVLSKFRKYNKRGIYSG